MTRRIALSEVAEVNPPLPASVRKASADDEVPYIAMSAVSASGGARYDERRSVASVRQGYTSFSRGDILLAKITPCFENGKAADLSDLPGEIGFGSTEFHVLRAGAGIDARYLFHIVWNPVFREAAAPFMTGTAGQKRLPADYLRRYRVPLPSLVEQRRIAAMLDKADGVRRRRREGTLLQRQFLRSSFLDVFGDPVRNDRAWPQMALSEIASVERGKFSPRPRNDPRYYGGPFPFVQTGDISRSNGIVRQWHQTLNEAGTSVSRLFPQGTIAMAIAANIGDTAIVDFDFYCPDSVVGIATRSESIKPEYLEYCLRFFKNGLEAAAPKTAQRNINLTVIRPLPLPVPPIELQTRFATLRRHLSHLTQRYGRGQLELERLHRSLSHEAFF
jgi:type I restriction enzyme S subunit